MDQVQAQKLLQQIRDGYLAEMPAKCDEIENLILAMSGTSDEHYAELYRTVHSMKGSSGTHGLIVVSAICHELEDQLAKLNNGADGVTEVETNILLRLVDLIRSARGVALENKPDFSETEKELESIRKETLQDQLPALLVESSGYVKLMCQEALSDLPVQLTIEEDGLLALQRMLQQRFAFIISAYETRALNGVAVIKAIRASESVNKHIKTVLITSRQDLRDDPCSELDYVLNRNADLGDNLKSAVKNILSELS